MSSGVEPAKGDRGGEIMEPVNTTTSLLGPEATSFIVNTEGEDPLFAGATEESVRGRGLRTINGIAGLEDELVAPGCVLGMLVGTSNSVVFGNIDLPLCEIQAVDAIATSDCKINHKGYWKRRARLQGRDTNIQEAKLVETQHDMIRKRGRGEELVESGTSPLYIPGKKREKRRDNLESL